MNEKKQESCPKCPFFDTCGAYIIWEKLGKNWSQEFCFGDFEKCDHFKIRAQIKH